MTRLMGSVALAVAVVCATAVASPAQTSTASETKAFTVIGVFGNQLVVTLPEGTREITVPEGFLFTVNGKQLSVRELTPGMKGTATITTKTTVVPVTVTEVKTGTVVNKSSGTVTVRTPEGVKMFQQGDIDKRGIQLMREGKPAQLVDFREGDRISATFITSGPPKILTEKEVQALVPTPAAAAATSGAAPAAARAPAPAAAPSSAAAAPAPALPKTASAWPFLALASVLSLVMGLALTIARRRLVG